jgi:putative ABC transport system permease protein
VIALYRALLVLYPAVFRRAYGEDMVDTFAMDLEHARTVGARFRLAMFVAMDLIRSAARLRWRAAATELRRRRGRGTPGLPRERKGSMMDTLLQDVRFGLRQFVRRPGFTAIAVLSLALAVGGNSLIYGMVDGFVLHPFDYPDPDRLVTVGVSFPKVSSETNYVETMSPVEAAEIAATQSFLRTATFDLGNRNLSGGDMPEHVFTALLLDDPFPVLGVKPALGRGFTKEELAPKAPPVAIISHRIWQSRFGGDPNVLSRPVRIGGTTGSIVGVMPPGVLLIGTDLWVPWGADPTTMPRNVRQFTMLARLRPDAPLAQANAELATIAKNVEQTHVGAFKEYAGWRLTATPWAAALLKDVRSAAFMLVVAVFFVLLIACVNVANLLLARSTTRQRELAVRLALGAARWRLARQLLTETVLLAAAGAAGGIGLAWFGLRFAGAIVPAQFQMLGLAAGLNVRVLLWSLLMTVVCALIVGVLPAVKATRTDPHDSLKADGRAGPTRAAGRLRHGLVVVEIALSVVLLLGAALLIRSFLNIQRVPLGYDPKGVLTMRLTLPREGYATGEAITGFFERLLQATAQAPGVTAAAVASQFPPISPFNGRVEIENAAATGTTLPTAVTTIVSRGYFDTMRVPLMAGRRFDDRDLPGSSHAIVVNRAFVDRFLSGREPLGARVRINARNGKGAWSEIVGVVGDTRNQGAASPVKPEIFISMEAGRDAWNQLFLLVRSDRPASALLPDVRKAVSAVDAQQPVYAIQTLEEALGVAAFQQRISAVMLVVFAAVALVLAAIGIYGVMSYSVSARTQELGVRLAVGASRRAVMWLVMKQVLALAAIGLAAGIALLVAAGRGLERLLFGVHPGDPGTIAAVVGILAAVALAAAWIPARRASGVDPIQALRYE